MSELVPLQHPVAPVGDGLTATIITVEQSQCGEWHADLHTFRASEVSALLPEYFAECG